MAEGRPFSLVVREPCICWKNWRGSCTHGKRCIFTFWLIAQFFSHSLSVPGPQIRYWFLLISLHFWEKSKNPLMPPVPTCCFYRRRGQCLAGPPTLPQNSPPILQADPNPDESKIAPIKRSDTCLCRLKWDIIICSRVAVWLGAQGSQKKQAPTKTWNYLQASHLDLHYSRYSKRLKAGQQFQILS